MLGAANVSAVANQVNMHFEVSAGRNDLLDQLMSLFVRAAFWNQRESSSDPKNVRVYRKDGSVAGEQKGASDGLRTDSFEAGKESPCLVKRRAFQKRKVERASLMIDLVQQILNPSRFLTRESA
jgi:hypothetical protein